MKKIAILYKQNSPLTDAIRVKTTNFDVDWFSDCNFDPSQYDLIISAGYDDPVHFNVLKSHLSLLPSFDSKEPVKDAFLYGVKVTGVTVFYTLPQKIIAQYPVFIYNDAHFDELECELRYIEQTFFPEVIEKIIKNEPFESRKILNLQGCNACKGCSK